MKICDLCVCEVIAASVSTTLARTGETMRRQGVGALPVIDRNERIIGRVTDRDCFLHLAAKELAPSKSTVKDVPTGNPVTVRLDDDVRNALDPMARNRVHRLPVVDDDGRLQGILSIDDPIPHALHDPREGGIDHDLVLKTLCRIVQDYAAETGESCAEHERKLEA